MTARPFRVLSLDGGGMRGTYTATYLASLAATFARRRDVPAIDVGAAFDLIVGTSTTSGSLGPNGIPGRESHRESAGVPRGVGRSNVSPLIIDANGAAFLA